jgi:predicted polyphosphate/ATP-dependent NAD kinase
MSLVGIIANPESGKDIRRLVSHAIVASNQQKVNVVCRLLLSLSAMGVEQVTIMPEYYGIGMRALHELRDQPNVLAITSLMDMPSQDNEQDSRRAAQQLREADASCIIVLGGDGTCRIVASGCGEIPLIPISTGTNNVVPYFVEGTIAGLAGGYIDRHPEIATGLFCYRHKYLVVTINGQERERALVDVALVASNFVGSRAIWQPKLLRQVFVTRAQPATIGLSSLIGMLQPVGRDYPQGAWALINDGSLRKVLAPIVPGNLEEVYVGEIYALQESNPQQILPDRPVVLALDGEREIVLLPGDSAEVTLHLDGPWIVDIEKILALAVRQNTFVL